MKAMKNPIFTRTMIMLDQLVTMNEIEEMIFKANVTRREKGSNGILMTPTDGLVEGIVNAMLLRMEVHPMQQQVLHKIVWRVKFFDVPL
jgi:hypothetical protein